MNKRLNKEYILNISDCARVKYGSTNKDNPRVVYVSCNCWIQPTVESDYSRRIANAKSNLRRRIGSEFLTGQGFADKLILGYDISQENFTNESKKFLTVDFYLVQQGEVRKLKDLGKMMQIKVGNVISGLVKDLNENGFKVTKKKTELH